MDNTQAVTTFTVTVDASELMSVQDAAARLGVARYTAYRWIDKGRLHAIRLGGVLFVPRSEVERLKAEQAGKA